MKDFFKKLLKNFKEYWKKSKFEILAVAIITLTIVSIWQTYIIVPELKIERISYNDFMELVEENKVDTVSYNKNNEWMTITLFNENTKNLSIEERLEYKDYGIVDKRLVQYPAGDDFRKKLLQHNIILKVVSEQTTILATVSNIISITFTIVFMIIIFSMLGSMVNIGGSISKKDIVTTSDVKFDDIIGHDEILDDIKFISKLIKNPELGDTVGAKVPKGILLSGSPGCGKTLIAKAIAGETGIPFIYQNASSFIDRFVGVGAKHVRDLFKLAKKNAPCIVFIDEIDAIGMDREQNKGTSENDQTIDALLQEMDGFTGREGIFIIAATNRPDILDKALVRAGRFDRQIIVSKPRNWKIRKDLFNHYLEKFTISDDIDVENISKQVAGFTGADIAAVCNEASIIAIMNKKDAIDHDCLEEAIDKKIFKGNRTKKEHYFEDKKIVAYHESGHAVMSYLLNEPITRASIQSTVSGVGGVVFNADKDSIFETNKDYKNQILICYAGRASEEIKYKDVVTTGASNDITQATQIMVQYVEKVGFDKDFGMLDIGVLNKEHLIESSDITNRLSNMSKQLYNECKNLLLDNYNLVEALAEQLLEVETLSGTEIEHIFKQELLKMSSNS